MIGRRPHPLSSSFQVAYFAIPSPSFTIARRSRRRIQAAQPQPRDGGKDLKGASEGTTITVLWFIMVHGFGDSRQCVYPFPETNGQ